MINVAVDTNGLFTTQAGVARYIRGLVGGMREACKDQVSLTEIAWEVENFEYRQPQRMVKTFFRDFVWRLWIGPSRLRGLRSDVLHSTVSAYVRPPPAMGHVATIHDLAVFRFPERFRHWQGMSGRMHCRRAVDAGMIICISTFTADEVMKLLGVPASRLQVVNNGCDFHPDGPPPVERLPGFKVPNRFFLFVGSLEPGKNLQLLRSVYELAAAGGVSLPPLLIVGARWEGLSHEGAAPRDWHYLGRQPDEVLTYLYRRAVALAFPSKYEGFGLPVAEAMSLGCPVVCAPIASLPEVGGEAPIYADLTPGVWLKAMRELDGDDRRREACVQAGLVQARKFSWRKCALETVEVYRSALEA